MEGKGLHAGRMTSSRSERAQGVRELADDHVAGSDHDVGVHALGLIYDRSQPRHGLACMMLPTAVVCN